MKRFAAAVGVLAASIGMAMAQDAQVLPPDPIMDVGAGILFTESNDHFDNGVGAAVYIGGRPLPVIGLRASLSGWDCDTESDRLSPGSFYVTGIDASLLLHLDVDPAIHVWAGGGVGQYWLEDRWDDWNDAPPPHETGGPQDGPAGGAPVQDPDDDLEDDVGAHVLVGADLIIAGPVSFFVEGKYIWLETDARIRSLSSDGSSVTESRESLNLDTGSILLGVRVKL